MGKYSLTVVVNWVKVKSVRDMMGGLWMNTAKLMSYNRPAPHTFCTPNTPCFLCPWRQRCSGYNKGRKRNLITLNEALEEAKRYLGRTISFLLFQLSTVGPRTAL